MAETPDRTSSTSTPAGNTPVSPSPIESGRSSMSAVDREHELMRLAREAEEKFEQEKNALTSKLRAAERVRYNSSDQGVARAQQVEADRIMRLPTDQALEAMGSHVGDPTKGPSS